MQIPLEDCRGIYRIDVAVAIQFLQRSIVNRANRWEKLTNLADKVCRWQNYWKRVIKDCALYWWLGYFVLLTDDGMHETLCDSVGTELADYRRDEIPEVRRLAGTTSAGTWRHTLGMSTVPDDAAATCRLLCEVDCLFGRWFSTVQAASLFNRHLHATFSNGI